MLLEARALRQTNSPAGPPSELRWLLLLRLLLRLEGCDLFRKLLLEKRCSVSFFWHYYFDVREVWFSLRRFFLLDLSARYRYRAKVASVAVGQRCQLWRYVCCTAGLPLCAL